VGPAPAGAAVLLRQSRDPSGAGPRPLARSASRGPKVCSASAELALLLYDYGWNAVGIVPTATDAAQRLPHSGPTAFTRHRAGGTRLLARRSRRMNIWQAIDVRHTAPEDATFATLNGEIDALPWPESSASACNRPAYQVATHHRRHEIDKSRFYKIGSPHVARGTSRRGAVACCAPTVSPRCPVRDGAVPRRDGFELQRPFAMNRALTPRVVLSDRARRPRSRNGRRLDVVSALREHFTTRCAGAG